MSPTIIKPKSAPIYIERGAFPPVARIFLFKAVLALAFVFFGITATAAVGDVVASGSCGTTADDADGTNLTWTLTENDETVTISGETTAALTLTITGTGAMDDYTGSSCPWNDHRKRVTKLNLPEGITHIGNHAFYFTNFSGPLTIPSTVETIGNNGFYGLHGATSVNFPANLTSIGEYGMLALGSDASTKMTVTVAEGCRLSEIGAKAFNRFNGNLDLRNCTNMKRITTKDAFYGYEKTVTFPRSLTTIGANVFIKATENSNKPTVKISYKGFLFINDEFVSYDANETTQKITSKLSIYTTSSQAVTIYQGYIDNLTWNTDGKYYEINDEQDLIDFANYINDDESNRGKGLTFKMTSDLDFTNLPEKFGTQYTYQSNFQIIHRFFGHFDGNGHSITGLRFTGITMGVALFSILSSNNAVVEGVTIVSPTIQGRKSIGGIVGQLQGGTIKNCTVIGGTIRGRDNCCGGIVGDCYSDVNSIEGCNVIATTVSGSSNVGVICGSNSTEAKKLSIKNCTYHNPDNLAIVGGDNAYTDGGGNKQVYQVTLGAGSTTSTEALFTYGNKKYFAQDATVALAAAPDYTVINYSTTKDGTDPLESVSISETDGAYSFTMPANDVSVTAVWNGFDQGALKITVDENGKHATLNGDFATDDILAYNLVEDISVDDITISRTFNGNSTIILPFSVNVANCTGGTFCEFTKVDYDKKKQVWYADATEITSGKIEANHPYIFQPSSADATLKISGGVTISGNLSEECIFTQGDWQLIGRYMSKKWDAQTPRDYGFAGSKKGTEGDENYIKIGDFVRAGANAHIKPFRCYLHYTGDESVLISKSAVNLPDRIEVRIINSVVAPENNEPIDGGDDVTTPVSEIVPTINANVWSFDKTIYIAAAPNTPYTIVDVNGRPLRAGITATDRDEIHLGGNVDGIVIVIIANQSFKIKY